MGIDKDSDSSANLQIGPTTLGMVRIYVEGDGLELPLDFEPDEADEIADEIKAAAARAREMGASQPGGGKSGPGKPGGTRQGGGKPGADRGRR